MANSALLTLPDLGEGLTQARVLSLLTPAGGKTEVDAPVVVVETDKSVVELPAPLTGYLAEWFVRESDVIRVGEPLARFDAEPAGTPSPPLPAAAAPPAAASPAAAQPAVAPRAAAPAAAAPPAPTPAAAAREGDKRPRVSPAARRRARDLGIELDAVVAANGAAHGPISAQTVQRFSEQSHPNGTAAPAAAAPAAAASTASISEGTLVVLSRRLDVALLREGIPWLGLAESAAQALFRAAQRVAGQAPQVALPAGLRVRRFGEGVERRWFACDFAGAGLTEAAPGSVSGPVWEVVSAPGDALAAFSAGPARTVQLTVAGGANPSVSLVSTDPAWGEQAVLLLWDEFAAALHAGAFDRSSVIARSS